MDSTSIRELLLPFLQAGSAGGPATLSELQLRHISMYIDMLLRWNARINLTAVRSAKEIVTRHFGESLFAARLLFPAPNDQANMGHRFVDFGSGPGFPGLPIKILVPAIHATLIESNQKKATFLKEVRRALTLTDVDVFSFRAEEFPAGQADTVTLRAVERFETVLPSAVRLLAPD
ncbi:MAG TPA: 16S rRNA (guanine(527)-N(7))-methyltransferase RsmG, partial [Terriglobales bacterium]